MATSFCKGMVVCYAGVGKGMIGAVTLPTGGLIDFGTYAFEGIHR